MFADVDPRIRFYFLSDDVADNNDGWIIDSLSITQYEFVGSVDDQGFETDFNVYPNPVSNTQQLEMINQINMTQGVYTLFDLSGRKITSKSSQGIKTEIDVSDFNPGVYMIRWNGNDGRTKDQKVIVR